MSALDKAKAMNFDELKAKAAGLLEFGSERIPVTEKWDTVIAERAFQSGPIYAAAGLNNADVDKTLLCLLKDNEDKVIEGLSIAALAVNADKKAIFVPEGEEAYAEELAEKAEKNGIEVCVGLVDRWKTKGSAKHHFETLIALAEIIDGTYEPGVYLAVKEDGKTGEVKKYPYGTKLSDIVDADDVKAVALGNVLYDDKALDMEVDEAFPMENGVITVYKKNCCMVNETKKVLDACSAQSCGKCTFCREGLIQLREHVTQATEGKASKGAVPMIEEIGEAMTFSTLCTLGKRSPVFALNALELFDGEFKDHIKKKKCPNNVCSAFSSIYIDPNECQGCSECMDVCPKDAIEGKSGFIHMIDEYECDKCGKCIEACEEEAIILTTGKVPKLPTRLIKVGKFKKR